MARIAVLLLYFGVVTAQVSNKSDCEKYAKKEFDRVKGSFVIPSNFSFPSPFDEIHDLLNRLNNLVSNIGDLDDIRDNHSHKTDQLKEGIELLKSIRYEIELIKISRNRTTHECETAKDKFDMLMKDFNAIEKLGSEVNKSVAHISEDIEKTKEKSVLIQNEFQGLKIPDFTAAKYLCSTRFNETIKGLVNIAQNIKIILLQQKDEVLSKLKDIKRDIGIIERSEKKVPSPVFEGGKENLINQLQKQVTSLRSRIETLKRTKSPLVKWNDLILKLEQQLKEDIQNAKEIKNILIQRDKSKKSYEEIGKIVEGLCKGKVCIVQGPVGVEQ